MNLLNKFEIYRSCKHLPVQEWQRLVPNNNLLHNVGYLALIENHLTNNVSPIYAFVRTNNELVAAAYFQLVHFNGKQLSSYTKNVSPIKRRVFNVALSCIHAELLVGANLLMTGEKGFFYSPDLYEKKRWEIYVALVEHLLQTEKHLNGFLITDVFEEEKTLQASLFQNSYHRIEEEPDMELSLRAEWENFHHYINALSSKYRVRAKRCFVLSQNLKRIEMGYEDISAMRDELYNLYLNTIKKSSFSLITVNENFFAEQKKLLNNNYHFFGYFLDDKLVGFNSVITLDGRGEVHYIGLNYELNTKLQIYQRMLMDMIDFGIAQRLQTLHFGRTAIEIKCSIGAKPKPIYGYVKHKSPIINQLVVASLARAIKPKSYTFRNPFKAPPENPKANHLLKI